MIDKWILVGVIRSEASEYAGKGWLMVFHPGESERSGPPLIGLQEPYPTGGGTAADAAYWLSFRPLRWHWEGARIVKETGPGGWFETLCSQNGLDWFLRFVVRIAVGEKVSMEEVRSAYIEIHPNQMPIEGTMSQIFDYLREKEKEKPLKIEP